MCGIFGYAGPRPALPVLMDGLRRLEYRGYDSAGVAVWDGETLAVRKSQGRLDALARAVADGPLPGHTGIGHTRWATHGAPSGPNAHPQTDASGRFALAHNGIIDNAAQLRAELEREGVAFRSQTDTEAVVQLMAKLWRGDLVACMLETVRRLQGSYALVAMSALAPGEICCIRRDSPLVVGLGEGERFVASDIPALLPVTRRVTVLRDGEPALLTAEGCRFFDADGRPVERGAEQIAWQRQSAEKGPYPHFMRKEISEQPSALRAALSAYTKDGALRGEALGLSPREARRIRRVVLVGCGSACHAAMAGRHGLERLCRLPVAVEIASEMRHRDLPLDERDLCVCISQSGETADTLAALRLARGRCRTLGVVNAVGSTLAREADSVLYTHAGPEIAVATTKGYTTQVLVLTLLALGLAGMRAGEADAQERAALLAGMARLPAQMEALTEGGEAVRRMAHACAGRTSLFYMGRGVDYAQALEASLKMKEIAYLHSEAYAAGELKHGTIALVEPGTQVIALATQPALLAKMAANIHEVRSRGARVLALAARSLSEGLRGEADEIWTIPDTEPLLTPLLGIVPMQLLAYETALARGCDVDKPRNLAKSVTVE